MLNIGDSDTIGSIASAWYGALYGFDKVPLNLIIKTDDYYLIAEKLSKSLYLKYYDKTINQF